MYPTGPNQLDGNALKQAKSLTIDADHNPRVGGSSPSSGIGEISAFLFAEKGGHSPLSVEGAFNLRTCPAGLGIPAGG